MSLNWGGNVAFSARAVHAPRSVPDLQYLVSHSERVRVLGSRHSFSAVADTVGDHLDLSLMPPTLDIDSASRRVRVSGALRYADIVDVLDDADLALPNLGSLPHITVAGSCATGTHGSGDHNQILACSVSHLDMVVASGDLVTITSAEPDFDGAVVSLGALGAVVTLTLDLVAAFSMRQTVYEGMPLDCVAEQFDQVMSAAYSVSVFTSWVDGLADVWVKDVGDRTPDAEWLGAHAARVARHPIPGESTTHTTEQLGIPGRWHDRLPHFRADGTPSAGREIQSEYFISRSDAKPALDALRAAAPAFVAPLLRSEIRTIAADRLWLSGAYDRDSVAMHFTWRLDEPAVQRALIAVETALEPFAPRAHWGKVFLPTRTAATERPRLADFLELARSYDPTRRFANAFTDALSD